MCEQSKVPSSIVSWIFLEHPSLRWNIHPYVGFFWNIHRRCQNERQISPSCRGITLVSPRRWCAPFWADDGHHGRLHRILKGAGQCVLGFIFWLSGWPEEQANFKAFVVLFERRNRWDKCMQSIFLNVLTTGLVLFFTIDPPNSTIPDDTNQFFSTFPPQVFGEMFYRIYPVGILSMDVVF